MRFITLLLVVTCLCIPVTAAARDALKKYSIAEALSTSKAAKQLDKGYQFKFGNQSHSEVVTNFGQFTAKKTANSFAKSTKDACQQAFLSTLEKLQTRINREGGNALIGIHSFYKTAEFNSTAEFECSVGSYLASVTLRGEVVELAVE